MFKTEQNIVPRSQKSALKAVLKTGITLAKPTGMKRNITYKEITLVLGILVAVVVAFTLWVSQPSEHTTINGKVLPIPSAPVTKSVVKAAVDFIF